MSANRRTASAAVLLLAGAAAIGAGQAESNLPGAEELRHQTTTSAWAELANTLADEVTIYRDAFGVPHSHGTTDAAAAFGYAFAQAQDNYEQIIENFLRAEGRAAEFLGAPALVDDWLSRSMRIEELARDEYDASDTDLRSLLDAYAAGVNAYAAQAGRSPAPGPGGVQPWHPLALIRYLYFHGGFLRSAGLRRNDFEAAYRRMNPGVLANDPAALTADPDQGWREFADQGSNSWAVGPSRTADGSTMLFINPHLPHFGPAQVYEGHLSSDEGWNFTGYGRFGFPMPYVGHNPDLGWASTDNAADLADAYLETFDDPSNLNAYRYGNEYREVEEWQGTISVWRNPIQGATPIQHRYRRTHHGPVVGYREGRWVSVRMAKLEEPGWLAQWYAMTKARTLERFLAAVEPLNMLFGNYTYADREGHILYVYNAAVPRRDPSFDWSQPVDGSDPRTEWQGYHPMAEIPQLLDPSSGYLQNCNSTPFLSSSTDNPSRDAFPSYMANEPDTARARNARRILEGQELFSWAEWTRLGYDTTLITANDDLPPLFEAWAGLPATSRIADLGEAMELLRAWNRSSAADSVATTLYILWGERIRRLDAPGADQLLLELAATLDDLTADWGDWRVYWGEINRAQRGHSSGRQPFDDGRRSVAIGGAPSWTGTSFTFWSAPVEGQRRRYGTGGNSYVSVVRFGKTAEGYSLMPFGQSATADSPHHLDQLNGYARGGYKRAWLHLDEVRTYALSSYRPAVPH